MKSQKSRTRLSTLTSHTQGFACHWSLLASHFPQLPPVPQTAQPSPTAHPQPCWALFYAQPVGSPLSDIKAKCSFCSLVSNSNSKSNLKSPKVSFDYLGQLCSQNKVSTMFSHRIIHSGLRNKWSLIVARETTLKAPSMEPIGRPPLPGLAKLGTLPQGSGRRGLLCTITHH